MEEYPNSLYFVQCPSCGEKNEKENRFCIHCGSPLQKRRGIHFRKRLLLFGMVIFVFIGGGFFLLRSSFESKFVGKVNGEGISRKEFSKRVDQIKKFYELRYGEGFFQGKEGKENLNRLKSDIFEEMVAEKILLQEAKNAGFSSAPQEEVEEQLRIIKEKYNLSDNDFKQKMGINVDDVKEELRKGWIISNFLKEAVFKGDPKNRESILAQWFERAKAKAKIETYEEFEKVSSRNPSCCSTGCSGGSVQPLDPDIEKDAKAKALEYYERKTQKKAKGARVTNYGCHIQVDIIEDGKVILSLTYNGREVQEI